MTDPTPPTNDLDDDRLAELVTEALERTVLVLADAVARDEIDDPTPAFAACTRFDGFAAGDVLLSCDTGFAIEAAAGLLGVEPDEVDPEEHGRQILDELANILGGSVITALGGDRHPYRQALPERLDAAETAERSGDVTTWMQSEDGWLCVTWRAAEAGAARDAA